MKKTTLTPSLYSDLIRTNGVYSLYRAEKPTDKPFAVEHFPTRELLDTFESEEDAKEFYAAACQMEREGKSVPVAESRPFTSMKTFAGWVAVAGMPLKTPLPTAQDAPEREAFHITDEASANWYLRKLAQIEAEKSRITAQYQKMVAELDSDMSGLRFLYQSELENWVKTELARNGGRKKTLHLLQGTASFRTVPASLKLADPVAALAHAKENLPAAVETVERLNSEEYRGCAEVLYKEFKTILPGMETVPARESFSVKFGGKPE